MANHRNAKKMARVIAKRTLINSMRKNKTRTCIKKLIRIIDSGDKKAVLLAFREAESNLQKCVNKGILHKNTAARKISRLCAKVKNSNLQTQNS